jgi:hypothetical protein
MAQEREAERRKDRLVKRAGVLGFVLIVGAALVFVGLRGGHRTLAVPTAARATPAPPPPPSAVLPSSRGACLQPRSPTRFLRFCAFTQGVSRANPTDVTSKAGG